MNTRREGDQVKFVGDISEGYQDLLPYQTNCCGKTRSGVQSHLSRSYYVLILRCKEDIRQLVLWQKMGLRGRIGSPQASLLVCALSKGACHQPLILNRQELV